MAEVGFLFPGQGSQSVGMVRELAGHSDALNLFHRAGENLGFDLFDLCLRGPEEKLSQDLNAQLAVHVTNCAYAALLKKLEIIPRMASGFSLGIFSALVAATSLTFEQGLAGVRMAAEKMSEEGKQQSGAMAAIIGLPEEVVQVICQEVPRAFVASINTAHQVVISGEEGAVEKAMGLCLERGALLVKRLPIGWAIHTPLMERATRAFSEEIGGWEIRRPRFPILSYLRAELLETPEEIKEELSAQFSRPNRWHKVLLRMTQVGVNRFVEVGPGNVLSQMIRWVNREALTFNAEEVLKRGDMPGLR